MNKTGFLFFGISLLIIGGLIFYIQIDKDKPIYKSTEPQPEASPLYTTSSQKRLALVIGNSNYKKDYFLTNPVNDAEDFAKVLRSLNFEVIEKQNLNKAEMERAILQFSSLLSDNKGVGLFYFSGHGIQHKGSNYLLPVGVQPLKKSWQLPHKTITAQYVLDGMEAAKNEVNIVILDACRDFPSSLKETTKGEMMPPGLSLVKPISGSVVAYAAAPGGLAASGGVEERNSPYVKHLMSWIQKPNLSIDEIFTNVGRAVKNETFGMQLPGYYKQLYEPFYFVKKEIPAPKPNVQVAQAEALRLEQEKAKAERDKQALEIERLKLEQAKAERDKQTLEIERLKLEQAKAEREKQAFEIERLRLEKEKQQAQSHGKVFQDSLKDGSLAPKMVWIKAGSFQMGSNDGRDNEKPVHEVYVDKFAMGQTEVTFAEYDKFAIATSREKPKDRGWGRDKRPVINVSWHDAVAYAKWLSEQTGHTYRLPTEAEWEYAARAGTTTPYSFGDDDSLDDYAWYGENWNTGSTHPVGEKKPNPWGLYDVHGNVWEWCFDIYGSYSSESRSNPTGPSGGGRNRSGSRGTTRRLVERQRAVRPCGVSQRLRARRPRQQLRLPPSEDALVTLCTVTLLPC